MIKKLLSSVREYKKNIILAPIYVTLESIFEILIPTFMAVLIDKGINDKNMSNILWMGLALVIAAFLALFFGVLAGRSAAIASSGFAKNLRHDLFYKTQTFSFSNIDKFSTSSIITRMTTDVTNIQNAFQMLVRLAVRAPMMILFAMIFSFRIDAKLSIIFVAIIPVLGIGLGFIMMNVHPLFKKVFKTYDNLNNIVQENLHGIRVVKSYTREEHEKEKFEAVSQSIFDNFSKAEKRMAFNMPLMQVCLYASMLLLSWFGAKSIIASGNNSAIGLSTGELTSMITYAMQILMSLMMLSMVIVMITISRASAERIVEILDEEVDLKNPDQPVYSVETGAIAFENVSFAYNKSADKPVLNNISLEIKSGETIGIIGGTGSSKSSLIQLIPRLYDTISGKVTVSGIDVRDYDLETLRNKVAVVLQKNVLFSGTIKENLRWGNETATDDELIHACKLAHAEGFIKEFQDQYDTYIEQGGTNVSGGQRQRLCIARALLKKPKILILDDSTSAVDSKTDDLIRQAFRQEIPNITKIIIAQRTSSIQDADKIIVMDDGCINAIGTHDELLIKSNIYKEVFESQTKGGGLNA